jgi:3-phosphoshikimate 1-carboxyvinyltransferase
MQGDIHLCDALEQMGCQVEWRDGSDEWGGDGLAAVQALGIDIDMNAISDTVPTLAVVALFADGTDDHSQRGPHP